MVEMFDDRIVISNPGGLPKGLKPEDFGKRSVLRNPNIADLLNRAEYIEKMGTGISRIRKLILEAGLKPPQFEFGTFFTVTFLRPKTFRSGGIMSSEKGSERSSEKILAFIRKNNRVSAKEIAAVMGLSPRAVEKQIAALKNKKILKRIGPDKGGYWKIAKRR
jgi:ATP-dependent DNA helicase RecG